MLSIKIGSSFIPVPPGLNLPLVMKSPLFPTSDSRTPGSYIFNTDFPATEQIKREFQQAHRFQRDGRATAELPYLIKFGILRYQGTCVVVEASEEKYSIGFRVDNGDFYAKIKDKTLKDLNLGGARTIADVCAIAHNKTIKINQVYQNSTVLPISLFDFTDIDIANNFSQNGQVYTAHKTETIKHEVKIDKRIDTGYLRVSIKKNNVEFFYQLLTDSTGFFYTDDYNLVANDSISVSLSAFSMKPPNGQDKIDITIFTISNNFLTDNIFDAAVNQDQTQSDFAIFPIKNAKFLDNFPDDAFMLDNLSIKTLYDDYFNVQNYFVGGKFPFLIYGNKEDEYFSAANLFTPFVYMSKLMNEIGILTGYTIVNSPFDIIQQFKGSVLFNAYAENTYMSESTSLLPVKPTFNLVDHVPAMNLNDFITWLSFCTGYMPVIDNNELTITFIKVYNINEESTQNAALKYPGILLKGNKVNVDPEYKGIKLELKKASDGYLNSMIKELTDKLVFKGTVSWINQLPQSGNKVNDIYLVSLLNSFYVWQYDPDQYILGWVFFSKDWPLTYTEGEEPFLNIKSEFSPVLTSEILDEVPGAPANRLWKIPITEQPGILEGFPDSLGAEYGIQMLNYSGMVLDSNGETYPLGTSNNDDYANSLFISHNARELFNAQYAPFLRWIAYQAKPGIIRAILTPAQLKKLKLHRIYYTDTYKFMIKELRVNILSDSLSVAEMDIYTC